MKFLEPFAILIILVGFGLKLSPYHSGNGFIISGLLLLSIIYFYFSFALFNNLGVRAMVKKSSYDKIHQLRLIGAIAAGFLLSAILTGILFKVLSLQGSDAMLLAGAGGIAVIMIVSIISLAMRKQKPDYFYNNIFAKGALMLSIAVFCLSVDTARVIRFYHADNPAYAELLIELHKKPNDPDVQKQLDEIESTRLKK